MYCRKCGEFMPDNSRICNNCGSSAKSDDNKLTVTQKADTPAIYTESITEHTPVAFKKSAFPKKEGGAVYKPLNGTYVK